jgi:hypothetical protein
VAVLDTFSDIPLLSKYFNTPFRRQSPKSEWRGNRGRTRLYLAGIIELTRL